jgi:hypothetical protein
MTKARGTLAVGIQSISDHPASGRYPSHCALDCSTLIIDRVSPVREHELGLRKRAAHCQMRQCVSAQIAIK